MQEPMPSTLPPDVEEPEPSAAARAARSRRRRIRRQIARRLVTWFGPIVLRALAWTWRVILLDEEHVEAARGEGGGRIITLWHGRMLLPVSHHANRNWCVLVSRSGDGDVFEPLLERFGYATIRGSSSRGGAHALREMIQTLRSGAVVVITPDGPRGPRHSMSAGVAWMARATGYAILPCGVVCDRAWRLKSWDRLTVPKPGARVVFVYGAPVRVDRDATDDELRAAAERIRSAMLDAERRGLAHVNREPDW